jgi:hypothetical protein
MNYRSKQLYFILLAAAFPVVIFLLRSAPANAQSSGATAMRPSVNATPLSFDTGTAAVWQSLQRLHTRASLLMVTAHPDDEDGGMLTYESRGQGAAVTLLTLNRGEGGANVMSPDYFERWVWSARKNSSPPIGIMEFNNSGLASATMVSQRRRKRRWTSGGMTAYWPTWSALCAKPARW